MQTCTCSHLERHRCLSRLRRRSLAQFPLLLAHVVSEKWRRNRFQLPPSGKGQQKHTQYSVWICFFGNAVSSLKLLFFLYAITCLQHWWVMETYSKKNVTLAWQNALKRCLCCSTCCPNILSFDAFLKLIVLQLDIIPVVTVQMVTPLMDSGEGDISKSHLSDSNSNC